MIAVTVEVLDYPKDVSTTDLCDEILIHFTDDPFPFKCFTPPDEMFDRATQTFKLKFRKEGRKLLMPFPFHHKSVLFHLNIHKFFAYFSFLPNDFFIWTRDHQRR